LYQGTNNDNSMSTDEPTQSGTPTTTVTTEDPIQTGATTNNARNKKRRQKRKNARAVEADILNVENNDMMEVATDPTVVTPVQQSIGDREKALLKIQKDLEAALKEANKYKEEMLKQLKANDSVIEATQDERPKLLKKPPRAQCNNRTTNKAKTCNNISEAKKTTKSTTEKKDEEETDEDDLPIPLLLSPKTIRMASAKGTIIGNNEILPTTNKEQKEFKAKDHDDIDDEEWTLTACLNHRKLKNGGPEFLVKWQNESREWSSARAAFVDDEMGCVEKYLIENNLVGTIFDMRKSATRKKFVDKPVPTVRSPSLNNKKQCNHNSYNALSYVEETNSNFCLPGFYLHRVYCAICSAAFKPAGQNNIGTTFKPSISNPAHCCVNAINVAGDQCEHVLCHVCYAAKQVSNDTGRSSRQRYN
jgi:hypothetical protein